MYVRTALRMVADRVLTQRDVVRTAWDPGPNDAIGIGSYTVDIPGPVQTIAFRGEVVNEGALKVPVFCDKTMEPYPLPYGIMVPRRSEAANLLFGLSRAHERPASLLDRPAHLGQVLRNEWEGDRPI